MNVWLEYLGRLHVLLVHFPIGLLVTAGLIEVAGVIRRRKLPYATSVVLAVVGAIGAVVAAGQGWILAGNTKHSGSEQLVEMHRWAGVAASVLGLLAAAAGLAAFWREKIVFVWSFRVLIIAAGVAVATAAHWGGGLIYGEEYFLPPIEQFETEPASSDTTGTQESSGGHDHSDGHTH